ncbi:hypothetical protein JOL62DRAFT_565241 [Phyllosticta paracitricarpa]|uniref:Uncharacterized protein n=1 Tax=Phyllosticta paracitricarpa TaxID=2016321 RepID=A0ABR1NH31_9PEZI
MERSRAILAQYALPCAPWTLWVVLVVTSFPPRLDPTPRGLLCLFPASPRSQTTTHSWLSNLENHQHAMPMDTVFEASERLAPFNTRNRGWEYSEQVGLAFPTAPLVSNNPLQPGRASYQPQLPFTTRSL